MVILLYVYYSSVILYFGAEFTKVYAQHHGVRIQPSTYAIQMTDQQRAEQGMPRQEQVEAVARQAETAPPPKAPDQKHPGESPAEHREAA